MKEKDKFSSLFRNQEKKPDKEDREELKKVWTESSKGDPAQFLEVSEREVSDALETVKTRIEEEQNETTGRTGNYSFLKYAAAAVFLIFAFGLAYILIPVTIEVPNGESRSVTLPDQSRVQLNSGSQISYSRLFEIGRRTVQLEGEAFFEVASGNSAFEVRTGNAVVSVTGTKFNVQYWPSEKHEQTSVYLAEGSVSFRSLLKDTAAVELRPGQQSWVSSLQQSPAKPVTAESRQAMDWRHNSIAFQNETLLSIFSELQRRYDIKITGDPALLKERITIYLSDIRDAEQALKDICQATGLTYSKENGTFLIYRN